jgi:hypothetical protein
MNVKCIRFLAVLDLHGELSPLSSA